MDITKYLGWVEHFIIGCSVLGLLAPPLEWFNDWPKFQNVYRLFLVCVSHYGSLNFRSSVWGSQFNNGTLKADSQAVPPQGQPPSVE